jgi:hypothetical protein
LETSVCSSNCDYTIKKEHWILKNESRITSDQQHTLMRGTVIKASLGFVFGAILGLILGDMLGSPALGLIFGAGIGLIFGAALDRWDRGYIDRKQ